MTKKKLRRSVAVSIAAAKKGWRTRRLMLKAKRVSNPNRPVVKQHS